MKKLLMITNESVYCGKVTNGMAELIDGLANSLSSNYEVIVLTSFGESVFINFSVPIEETDWYVVYQVFNVKYYLIKGNARDWFPLGCNLINTLKPEIIQAFVHYEVIDKLNYTPLKTICTFEQIDEATLGLNFIDKYDIVNTISKQYKLDILRRRSTTTEVLNSLDFRGIPTGIPTEIFNPSSGLFLPARFNKEHQKGKEICKQQMLKLYGMKGDPCVFVTAGRLIADKGIQNIIDNINIFEETGSYLILVGKGEAEYEKQLFELDRQKNFIWVRKWASPISLISLIAGADFYLSPSDYETCGLMPMNASRYGCIPIVTQNGGLRDNFDKTNALIITEDLKTSVLEACELYKDKNALLNFRKQVMSNDLSWATRKQGYIDMYES